MDILTIILILGFLFFGILIGYFVGDKIATIKRDRYWELELPSHRKDAVIRSRSVLSGMFSEQLAPFLPDFPFAPTECKFLGKPVDFIVFKGMDEKKIDEFESQAKLMGTDVKIISTETGEGVQLKEMGKVAAILRYEVNS